MAMRLGLFVRNERICDSVNTITPSPEYGVDDDVTNKCLIIAGQSSGNKFPVPETDLFVYNKNLRRNSCG